MATRYSPKIVTDGLVLSLDAANKLSYPGTGTTWYDLTNSGYIGTLTNGPTFNNVNGGIFIFDGIDDYVQTNYSQNTNDALITWECWFWDNSPGGFLSNTAIVSNYGPVGTTPFTVMHIYDNGNVFFAQRNSSGTESSATYSVNICNGIWHHIVGVIDSTNTLIYVDGILRASQAKVTGTTTSGQNIVIGGNHLGRYQSCRMAGVRIYNIALTATQVLQNYNANKTRFGLT